MDEDIPEIFTKPLGQVLRFYEESMSAVRHQLLGNPSVELQAAIQPYKAQFESNFLILVEKYNTYVAAIDDQSLKDEVMRLEELDSDVNERKLSFLVLKRMYERLLSFHESVKVVWRETIRLFAGLRNDPDCREPLLRLWEKYFKPNRTLLKDIENFLDHLQNYLSIKSKTKNQSGAYKINAPFLENRSYQIEEILKQTPQKLLQKAEKLFYFEKKDKHDWDVPIIEDADRKSRSPAQNIFLHLQDKNADKRQYTCISIEMRGSRTWNRLPIYYFELLIRDWEECLQDFDNCCLLNIDGEDFISKISEDIEILEKKGEAKKQLEAYAQMLRDILEALSSSILEKDFSGIREPEVFLYHCTPHLIYRLFFEEVQRRGIGTALYIEKSGKLKERYPEAYIKKIFIEWWKDHFSEIKPNNIDSYWLYSQQLYHLKRVHYDLYQEAYALQKQEKRRSFLVSTGEWLWQNRESVFGRRRCEIFERFSIKANTSINFKQSNKYILENLSYAN